MNNNQSLNISDQDIEAMIKDQGRKKGWVANEIGVSPSFLSRCFSLDDKSKLSEERKSQIIDLLNRKN